MKHTVLTAAAAFTFALSAHAQTPVKIGFMGVLSGPQAALGQDMLDAFMLVVEQNGGKLGGVPVEVIRRDSQLKPEVANQIADELIEKEKVPLVTGMTFSNILMAVGKKFTNAGVVVVGSNAGPAPLAGAQCSPNLFVVSKQNDQFAEAMGKYATTKGYKRIISMTPNYQAGKDYIVGFKRQYKTPLLDEMYTPLNQLDFSAELARIVSEKPDAVYAFYPGGLGVSFVRAYQQAGLLGKIPLLTTSTTDGTTLPALKDTALGVLLSSSWGPDMPGAANQKFVSDFEGKYKRTPSEYAAYSYDAALLIDSALRKTAGSTDRAALTAALKAADFKSVRGNFKFGNNNYPIQDFYVYEVAKDAKGNANIKTVSKELSNYQDAYAKDCPLK
ncbi:MAG: ABC transporter substrate-binding protein [Burkholderiales bacterium]|uniref:ABC transporter substrate-binding protein n=1 Tax=Ottowia pentelensis TaxID=511108 RepID=A0ABV6PSV7_9BURK|nr:ABC transporter substrate-binding protein [Ottowia sp.]MBN9405471.1 ABC transporter substrate-binding protein [Burkholderiales bacterium]MBS0403118.1 ABC transporter substrate-binding protein [Pseudomonadota bacterium]MBS0414398.1 ABC transporter substrate-binding protein [Pseudomonadota bacterium]HMN58594.1 ABC transporter substrate-binding protein [Ottowia sp.]